MCAAKPVGQTVQAAKKSRSRQPPPAPGPPPLERRQDKCLRDFSLAQGRQGNRASLLVEQPGQRRLVVLQRLEHVFAPVAGVGGLVAEHVVLLAVVDHVGQQ